MIRKRFAGTDPPTDPSSRVLDAITAAGVNDYEPGINRYLIRVLYLSAFSDLGRQNALAFERCRWSCSSPLAAFSTAVGMGNRERQRIENEAGGHCCKSIIITFEND